MKTKSYLLLILLSSLVFTFASFVNADSSCSPNIKLVSFDPTQIVPDSYVKVLFEVSGLVGCNGFAVRLNPEYPFSVDSNESLISTVMGNIYNSGSTNTLLIPYKLRVDKDALEGDATINIDYHQGSSTDFTNYAEVKFNVTIQDSRTQFDSVIQDTSGSQVSIAIANVGKYTANSVVVRIPDQDSYIATGTDGQMVGNINSGDYTIVSFSVSPKSSENFGARNSSTANFQRPQNFSSTNLKFDIYYTDNIGIRRIVNMQLPLKIGNSTFVGTGAAGFTRGAARTSSSPWYFSWQFSVILVIILIVLFVLYKKYPQQTKNFLKKLKFHKKDSGSSSNSTKEVPDWIKRAKEKEKKK